MSQDNLDDEEWQRSEEALRRLHVGIPPPNNSSLRGNSNSGQIFQEEPKVDDFIDSALSDTLQNPQERMNVLKFENKILHFVKSRERVLNVPPMANSFHRLLVYRIAQRFQLEHTYADTSPSADTASQGFSIVKTSCTRIPSPLLIDIPLKEEVSNVSSSQSVSVSSGGEGARERGGKKPVLMKRDSNKAKKQQRKKTDVNKDSTSDKEKAYAAARARIFGDEGGGDSPSGDGGGSSSGAGVGKSGSSGSVSSQRTAVAAINTSEKKVTYRDRQKEMHDPDFVRRAPLGASMSGAGGYPSNGGFHDPYLSQQQPYHQQQHYHPSQQQFPQNYTPQQMQQQGGYYPPPQQQQQQQHYQEQQRQQHGGYNNNNNNNNNNYNDDNCGYGYNMFSSASSSLGLGDYPTSSSTALPPAPLNGYDQFGGGLHCPPPAPSGGTGQRDESAPVSNLMRGLYTATPSPPPSGSLLHGSGGGFESDVNALSGHQQSERSDGVTRKIPSQSGASTSAFSLDDFPKLS